MSSNPLISVVIPMYNAEKFISKCLEHLIHQTYKNLEIIIVDDGSADNSVKICKQYALHDKRIKIIRQKNSGPACARNTGLDASSGDYVHFHDSDDFVETTYYQNMVNAILQSQADIICGEVAEIGYTFPTFDRVKILVNPHDKISAIRAHQFNVVWRFLYRNEFIKKNKLKFPVGMFIGEDKIFMFRALHLARTVATAPGARYHCIYEPSSLGKNSQQIMRGRQNGRNTDRQKFNEFMENSGLRAIILDVKRGQLEYARHWDFFGLHLWTIDYYSNGDRIYRSLGLPMIRRKITQSKIRYYLFGLYIYRKYSGLK